MIKLIVVGKIKENYLVNMIEDYFKRMKNDPVHNLAKGIVSALQAEDARIKATMGYLIGENHD